MHGSYAFPVNIRDVTMNKGMNDLTSEGRTKNEEITKDDLLSQHVVMYIVIDTCTHNMSARSSS